MPNTPLISIVVPTRNRADTLIHSLATIVGQKGVCDEFEIIVSDNNSSEKTKSVVDSFGSNRIRYIRSDKDLCMSDNYELGVSMATGDYIMAIGDDDGMTSYAIKHLAALIKEHDEPAAIHWRRGLYTWPNINIASEANFLSFSTSKVKNIQNGRELLGRAALGQIGSDSLPMINTSIIRRDILEEHRKLVGRIFINLHPDVYTGYAAAFLCKEYVSISVSLSIAGLSGHSTGVATLMRLQKDSIAREAYSLPLTVGIKPHAKVPADIDLWTIHPADCFLHAKDALFPDDASLVIDRKDWTKRHLAAIPHQDPGERAEIRQAIRASLSDSPELLDWFDREAPDFPPCRPPKLRPDRFGFVGDRLTVDTTPFGIKNIQQAVEFVDRLYCFSDGDIVYEPDMSETIAWHRADAEANFRASLEEHIAWHRADAEAALLKRMNG